MHFYQSDWCDNIKHIFLLLVPSNLLNVVVVRGRRDVLCLAAEDGGVGGRLRAPAAARVVGGEGRHGPSHVLHTVQVGDQHRGGGLGGDGPAQKRRRDFNCFSNLI